MTETCTRHQKRIEGTPCDLYRSCCRQFCLAQQTHKAHTNETLPPKPVRPLVLDIRFSETIEPHKGKPFIPLNRLGWGLESKRDRHASKQVNLISRR